MRILAPRQQHAHFCEICELPWICGEEHPRCARPWLEKHPGDAGRVHHARLPLQTAPARAVVDTTTKTHVA